MGRKTGDSRNLFLLQSPSKVSKSPLAEHPLPERSEEYSAGAVNV